MAWVDTAVRHVRRAPRRARHGRRASACSRSSSSRAPSSRSASRRGPGELEVVLHSSPAQLDAAQPWVPLARRLTAPAARRYVVGWAGPRELHVLCPRLLAHRASNVEGSLEMLMLAPSALLRAALRRRRTTRSSRRRSRRRGSRAGRAGRGWSRAPRSGSAARRGTCAPRSRRRLREGPDARVPAEPRRRAAARRLVFDLLAREEGDRACVTLARGPHPDGPMRALEVAFPRVRAPHRGRLALPPRAALSRNRRASRTAASAMLVGE